MLANKYQVQIQPGSSKATLQRQLLSVSVMASPQTQTACGEHKLSIEEETKGIGVKLLKRAQWLRAAILGANDGLLSTTSLMLGVGAAKEDQRSMILSGLAGAVAGACSMAVGEYVSVSTQRDIEAKSKTLSKTNIDEVKPVSILCKSSPVIVAEKKSPLIQNSPVSVYSPKSPIMKVMDTDSKNAKTEMETETLPNPYKAAVASAVSFLFGSLFPLIPAMLVSNDTSRVLVIILVASIALALFGGLGAYLGGSCVSVSALRVLLGGWVSMGITYGLLKPLDKDRKVEDSD